MTLPELYEFLLGLLRGTCAHCGFASADRCTHCRHRCCVVCADGEDGLCPTCHMERLHAEQAAIAQYRQIVRQVIDEERLSAACAERETIVSLPALLPPPTPTPALPPSLRAIAARRRQQQKLERAQEHRQQTEPLHLHSPGIEALWRLSAIKQEEEQARARARKQRETR